MWCRALLVSFVLFNLSDVEGVKFRYDYAYNKLAEGWLKLHRVPASWDDARFQCYLEGAVLASPLTKNLQDALIATVLREEYPPSMIYTGVHATFSKGTYNSIEGVPLSKIEASWGPYEPDRADTAQDCLAMVTQDPSTNFNVNTDTNGTVVDLSCNTTLPYICYKKKAPLVISGCGTNDPEYQHDSRTGSCYKFHQHCATWAQAYKTCDAEGAYLAIVNSDDEAQVLNDLFCRNPKEDITRHQHCKTPHEAFIGFLKGGYGEAWMTIHGESLKDAGYEKWTSGNPSGPEKGLFCGSYYREGDFSDNSCKILMPFICEKNPASLQNQDYIYELV